MKEMVASGQLPHFFLRLIIAETDQTTLAGRYLYGVTSFERPCYQWPGELLDDIDARSCGNVFAAGDRWLRRSKKR